MWHYKTTYKHNINYCLKTDLIFTVEFGDQLIIINYLPFHSNESPKYNDHVQKLKRIVSSPF